MNSDYLNSLIYIVEYKSFSRAADKLFITQPTISNHINKLENELNTTLLIRNKKEVKLTFEGEIIYNYALNALQMEKNIKEKLNVFNQDISGNLEIASSSIPERYYLLNEINEFHNKYPNVKFTLKKYDSCEIINLLLKQKINFGIVGTRLINPDLEYIKLINDEIVLVGSKEFFNETDLISLDNLFDYDFISREKGSGTRKEVELFFSNNNFNYNKLNIIFEIEDNNCILDLLGKNNYLAFLSKKVFEKNKRKFKKIDFEKKIHREFFFVYNKRRVISPLAKKFKHFIIDNEKSL
ncbi:selenium metabolism-associated LysR family transcriptional regulator [Clostridiaceae bacterium HSG29]|nr:selenium metabolism-associated LysR family transcriptional regulator [Clostridiaceae bacterium HSG29]